MTAAIANLWPKDIQADGVLTPREILIGQAESLQKQTGGLLNASVIYQSIQDREVIGFEVTAVRTSETVRLFEVQKSPDLEYPVEILPPGNSIPDFLQSEVWQPGMGSLMGPIGIQGRWIKREWVASSPTEFTDKLAKLRATSNIKAVLLSLLSRSRHVAALNPSPGSS